jgi:hypothetical protein
MAFSSFAGLVGAEQRGFARHLDVLGRQVFQSEQVAVGPNRTRSGGIVRHDDVVGVAVSGCAAQRSAARSASNAQPSGMALVETSVYSFGLVREDDLLR